VQLECQLRSYDSSTNYENSARVERGSSAGGKSFSPSRFDSMFPEEQRGMEMGVYVNEACPWNGRQNGLGPSHNTRVYTIIGGLHNDFTVWWIIRHDLCQ